VLLAHCERGGQPGASLARCSSSVSDVHKDTIAEGVGDCLDLDSGHVAELHGRQLELGAVPVDFPQAWLANSTPPSIS
jgi:hypothetical protein